MLHYHAVYDTESAIWPTCMLGSLGFSLACSKVATDLGLCAILLFMQYLCEEQMVLLTFCCQSKVVECWSDVSAFIEVPQLIAMVAPNFLGPHVHSGSRRRRYATNVQYFVVHVANNVEIASATATLTRNKINNQLHNQTPSKIVQASWWGGCCLHWWAPTGTGPPQANKAYKGYFESENVARAPNGKLRYWLRGLRLWASEARQHLQLQGWGLDRACKVLKQPV